MTNRIINIVNFILLTVLLSMTIACQKYEIDEKPEGCSLFFSEDNEAVNIYYRTDDWECMVGRILPLCQYSFVIDKTPITNDSTNCFDLCLRNNTDSSLLVITAQKYSNGISIVYDNMIKKNLTNATSLININLSDTCPKWYPCCDSLTMLYQVQDSCYVITTSDSDGTLAMVGSLSELVSQQTAKNYTPKSMIGECGKDAYQNCIIPFVSGVFSDIKYHCHFGKSIASDNTITNSHGLALAVILGDEQNIQVLDSAVLLSQPVYIQQFFETLPNCWDETRLLEGYPGDYCVVARRSGTRWYIAGISATPIDRYVSLSLERLSATFSRYRIIEDEEPWSGKWSMSDSKICPRTVKCFARGGFVVVAE